MIYLRTYVLGRGAACAVGSVCGKIFQDQGRCIQRKITQLCGLEFGTRPRFSMLIGAPSLHIRIPDADHG